MAALFGLYWGEWQRDRISEEGPRICAVHEDCQRDSNVASACYNSCDSDQTPESWDHAFAEYRSTKWFRAGLLETLKMRAERLCPNPDLQYYTNKAFAASKPSACFHGKSRWTKYYWSVETDGTVFFSTRTAETGVSFYIGPYGWDGRYVEPLLRYTDLRYSPTSLAVALLCRFAPAIPRYLDLRTVRGTTIYPIIEGDYGELERRIASQIAIGDVYSMGTRVIEYKTAATAVTVPTMLYTGRTATATPAPPKTKQATPQRPSRWPTHLTQKLQPWQRPR